MFERNDVHVREERSSRKHPLEVDDVRALLKDVRQVSIARGRKTEVHAAADVTPEMLKGPSGNFRAPMLIRGRKMLVGFSSATLEQWFD